MSTPSIRVSESLQVISHALERTLNEIAGFPVGFSLQVWTDGRMNYISNCDRDVMREQLRLLLADWDRGMPDVPAHKVN